MRNLSPRRAGVPETQPGEKRGWASAARERNAPRGGAWRPPGDSASSARAEVSEDLEGSAWSRTRGAPWGPRAVVLSWGALGDPEHTAEGPAHLLLSWNVCPAWEFTS